MICFLARLTQLCPQGHPGRAEAPEGKPGDCVKVNILASVTCGLFPFSFLAAESLLAAELMPRETGRFLLEQPSDPKRAVCCY